MAWALPSVTISAASALVLGAALVFLQHDAYIQTIFQLGSGAALSIQAIAAGLAFGVLLAGSRRPGPLWPRVWVLVLLAAMLGNLAVLFIWPGSGKSHAFAVASAAAAAMLSLRFVSLAPHQGKVRWLLPVALPAILGLCIGAVLWSEEVAAVPYREKVNAAMTKIKTARELVAGVHAVDWGDALGPSKGRDSKQMEDALEAARTVEAQLHGASTEAYDSTFSTTLREAIRDAQVLDLGEGPDGKHLQALEDAYSLLVDEVAKLLPDSKGVTAIPLSTNGLATPPQYYDAEQSRWVVDQRYVERTELVWQYHATVAALVSAIAPGQLDVGPDGGGRKFVEAYQRLEERRTEGTHALEGWFGNAWISSAYSKDPPASWSELLRAPLAPNKLAIGDLWAVFRTDWKTAKSLVDTQSGCKDRVYDSVDSTGTSLWIGRIDCYAYQGVGEGARVRVEARIVYELPGRSLESIDTTTLPHELYLVLLVPAEQFDEVSLREEVSRAISVALGDQSSLSTTDGTGLLAPGFTVRLNEDRLWIGPPRRNATAEITLQTGEKWRGVVVEAARCPPSQPISTCAP